tara:strand:- start:6059 stop:6205 length:147 start_codon:yes stop_codon:yes gene_type:complete
LLLDFLKIISEFPINASGNDMAGVDDHLPPVSFVLVYKWQKYYLEEKS